MRILSTVWFTNSTGQAGIVVTESAETKEVRAYIGVGLGKDEELDAKRIANWGTAVSPKCLVEILNLLTPPEKGAPVLSPAPDTEEGAAEEKSEQPK